MVYPYPTGGRTPRTPQGGQEKANLGSTVQKAVPPKDLINLRSPSGEVYRFACKTCIDGHRAPTCHPDKHRHRVMWRRPNPGRPARNCGHVRSDNCQCITERTLCCFLTPDQWDEVSKGNIIQVPMYSSEDDLNAARELQRQQRDLAARTAPQIQSQVTHGLPHHQQQLSQHLNGGSHVTPMTDAQGNTIRLQLMGAGGPQGTVPAANDPFNWNTTIPNMPLFSPGAASAAQQIMMQSGNQASAIVGLQQDLSTYQANMQFYGISQQQMSQSHAFDPELMRQSIGSTQQTVLQTHEQPQLPMQHGQFGQFQVQTIDRHNSTGSSGSSSLTPNTADSLQTPSDPDILLEGQHQYQMAQDSNLAQLGETMLDAFLRDTSAMNTAPSGNTTTHAPAEMMSHAPTDMMSHPTAFSDLQGMAASTVHNAPLHPLPVQTTQSCCSRPSQIPSAQLQMPPSQVFHNLRFPGLAPAHQFPCSKCASAECTCTDCPPTMQNLSNSASMYGAWAQSCGRTGHLGNPFPAGFIPQGIHGSAIAMSSENIVSMSNGPPDQGNTLSSRRFQSNGLTPVLTEPSHITGMQPRFSNNVGQEIDVESFALSPTGSPGIAEPPATNSLAGLALRPAERTSDPNALINQDQDPMWGPV